MEPRIRASPEQFLALIKFMETHGDLSKPQAGAQGRLRGARLWLELSSQLNSIGSGVEKSEDKWKKVWADWKTKTKKKYMLIRRHASGTDGGPSSRQTLTALEERVVAILGVSAVGQGGIQEQGFNSLITEKGHLSDSLVTEDEGSSTRNQFVLKIASTPIPSPASRLPLARPPPLLASQSEAVALSHGPRPSTGGQVTTSSRFPAASLRRRLRSRARRNRGQTSFDRATTEFVAIEQRRLQLEEAREGRSHELEMERLRLESERVAVCREQNQLLRKLAFIGERLLDALTQHIPSP